MYKVVGEVREILKKSFLCKLGKTETDYVLLSLYDENLMEFE